MTSIQIETTTRCTLKCPACSRTLLSEKIKKPHPHYDIDPDVLYRFLDCEEGKKINALGLCGDRGDSIYYPKLFYLIEKFKPTKNFNIVTNGSYRDAKFWTELCARLDYNDSITFSIDGWDNESNNQYRVNSDWDSIMLGLDIVGKTNIKINWETNIFKFNFDKLDKIKKIAESKKAIFFPYKTFRFGREDLKPSEEFIDSTHLFDQKYISDPNIIVSPQCVSRQKNAISADHLFFPCGYYISPFAYYKSKLSKEKSKWSITDKTLDDIQKNALTPWINSIVNDMVHCEILCKMKCKQDQIDKEKYVI